MRTLAIVPDPTIQRDSPPVPPQVDDVTVSEPGQEAEQRPKSLVRPAAEMRVNRHHGLVMAGLNEVWEREGQGVIELAVLSNAYGLVHGGARAVAHGVALDQSDTQAQADRGAALGVREQVTAMVGNYDLVFALLDGPHLAALSLPLNVPVTVQQIVLTDVDGLDLVPSQPNVYAVVASGSAAARRWHVKAPYVRGFLFQRLCHQVAFHGPVVLEWLYYQPGDTERMFYKRVRWRPQWRLWQDDEV